jgi:hypothetical protein
MNSLLSLLSVLPLLLLLSLLSGVEWELGVNGADIKVSRVSSSKNPPLDIFPVALFALYPRSGSSF